MQFARGHAQPADHERCHEARPPDVLSPLGDQPLERLVELKGVPERQAEVDITEATGALQPYIVEPDRCDVRARILNGLEQARVHPTPRELRGVGARTSLRRRGQLAKIRDDLLPHLGATANRAHQHPVGVDLAVLANRLVSEIHVAQPLVSFSSSGR